MDAYPSDMQGMIRFERCPDGTVDAVVDQFDLRLNAATVEEANRIVVETLWGGSRLRSRIEEHVARAAPDVSRSTLQDDRIAMIRAHPALDASTFDEVVSGATPTLVDFWGPRCSACFAMAPAVEMVTGELADAVTLVQVNIYENVELVERLGIMSLPTLILFANGREAERFVGPRGERVLREELRSALAALATA